MKNRGPPSVIFLTIATFGIYAMVWQAQTRDEMVARGADIAENWHAFIPILNLVWLWKYSQGVELVTNGSTTVVGALLVGFLGPIGVAIIQGEFNRVAR